MGLDKKQLAMYGALALGGYFLWKHKVLLGVAVLGGYVVYQNYKPILPAQITQAVTDMTAKAQSAMQGYGRY